MADQHQRTFRKIAKESKNCFRFEEDSNGEAPIIGGLYVKKYAFPEGCPAEIVVTLEVAS